VFLVFYPTENLGAYGERNGRDEFSGTRGAHSNAAESRSGGKYLSSEPVGTARLDEIQAPILRVKLRHLRIGRRARQSHAAEYNRLLRKSRRHAAARAGRIRTTSDHQYTIRVEKA